MSFFPSGWTFFSTNGGPFFPVDVFPIFIIYAIANHHRDNVLFYLYYCVSSGAANSAQFARVDTLALQLEYKLPHFEVLRIIKTPDEWQVRICVRLCSVLVFYDLIPSYVLT